MSTPSPRSNVSRLSLPFVYLHRYWYDRKNHDVCFGVIKKPTLVVFGPEVLYSYVIWCTHFISFSKLKTNKHLTFLWSTACAREKHLLHLTQRIRYVGVH